LFLLGELPIARGHAEQGVASYDPQQHSSLAFLYGQDPGVVCRTWAALALWLLGYPDQALENSQAALTLAREHGHGYSLAYALNFAVILNLCRRDEQAARERAEELMTLTREQDFELFMAQATVWTGWARAEQAYPPGTPADAEEGIAQMRRGMAASRATGTLLWRPYHLALLAELYGKAGRLEEGLSAVAEALVIVDNGGERHYEAELHRLVGGLRLIQASGRSDADSASPGTSMMVGTGEDPLVEVEARFRQALNIARRQEAKSLELRAAMSLSRLLHQQGRIDEARRTLAEVYDWFTEGFDTPDLRDAKALLERLM
jgi:predicted ATPase